MNVPDLLPCDFCGNDDIQDWGESTWSRPVKWMYCTECHAQGPRVRLERNESEEAWQQRIIAAWNTRATPDPLSDPRVKQETAYNSEAVKALVDHLEMWLELASHCAIEDGVCCCGDNMDGHSHPMNCGHSPVDHGSYVAQRLVESTSAALRAIEEDK